MIGSNKKINNYQYGKRRANIDKNIKVLDSIAKEILILKNSRLNPSVAYIFKKVNNALAYSKNVKVEFDKYNTYVSSLINSKFRFAVPISSGTSNPNVKTRNSQVIVTDFGFLVAGAYNSQGDLKIIPRPTAGINLHFGGINKNQKIRSITKDKRRFWHYSSLALGVTVGKIDEKGYSDLFNGISPYLGINFRLEKQIRIGAGVLFVNDSDPNPITDNKIFDPAIYTMVSFDFENLFGTLGKVATKIIN